MTGPAALAVLAMLAWASSATGAVAQARFQLRAATPTVVQLEIGGNARVALTGHGLQLMTDPTAAIEGRLAPFLTLSFGPATPALRDLFVAARPGLAPGPYRVSIAVAGRKYPLPVVILVLPVAYASSRNLRLPPQALGAIREQRDAIFGGR